MFYNLTKRTTIQRELEKDLKETAHNYNTILKSVEERIHLKQRGIDFYGGIFDKLTEQFILM